VNGHKQHDRCSRSNLLCCTICFPASEPNLTCFGKGEGGREEKHGRAITCEKLEGRVLLTIKKRLIPGKPQ
jgi:hypothetical protein